MIRESKTNELSMERLVPCGMDLMPRLWSDPEMLSRWWGPEGFRTTTHSMNFEKGGDWRYTMHGPDGVDYPNLIKYSHIELYLIEYDHFEYEGSDLHFQARVIFEPVTRSITRVIFTLIFKDENTKVRICDEFGASDGLSETTGRMVREGQRLALVDSEVAKLLVSVSRLRFSVGRVPQDHLTWSPSLTARSPVEIVAHCGWSLGWIASMLNGKPYPAPNTQEGDLQMREFERGITDLGAAFELLESNTSKWVETVRGLSVEDLDRVVDLPFGLGKQQVRDVLSSASWHTNDHCAQIEYIQTILGDRDWGF